MDANNKDYTMVGDPMEITFSEKYFMVQEWLGHLYGQEPIPEYERSTETVDMLYELFLTNKRCDSLIETNISDMKLQMDEFRSKNHMISQFLVSIQFPICHEMPSVKEFSKSKESSSTWESEKWQEFDDPKHKKILDLSRELAKSIDILNMSSGDFGEMAYSIGNLCSLIEKHKAHVDKSLKDYTELQKMHFNTLELKHSLQRIKKKWQEQINTQKISVSERLENLKYLEVKSTEYQLSIEQFKSNLNKAGLTSDIFHSKLQELSSQLSEWSKKNKIKLDQLQKYLNLPADPSLVKLEIKKLSDKLTSLDQDFERSIGRLKLDIF